MAVNSTLTGLSQTAASNGPDGSTDAPSTLDDAIRNALAFIAQLRDAAHVYVGSIAGTNTVTGSISTTPTSYTTGQVYGWIVANTNTGAVTVNFNSIGAKSLTKRGTSPLVGGELLAGACVTAMYDGTQFQLLSASRLASGTAISPSSTTADFTDIPSWAKRITLILSGISTNGTSPPMVQIGDSGGIEATGYAGAATIIQNGTLPTSTAFSTGFGVTGSVSGGNTLHGTVVLTLVDAATNLWVATVCGGYGAAQTFNGGGLKALSSTLDRIRLTTVGGSDVFDAGSINILYE